MLNMLEKGLLAGLLALAITAPEALQRRPYLEAAVDAAEWIRASAIETGAGLTWPADPANPKSTSATLYSGSPGVVLFFVELHRATGRAEYLRDAKAGADELLARLDAEKGPGLYTGIAGIGFTLAEVHRATGEARYRDGARRVVRLLRDRAAPTGRGIQWTEVTDIVGGNAGTGLFLLYAAEALGEPEAVTLASAAADRLLEIAVVEREGLHWAMAPQAPRRMPNFSHGTAGIAYFLARVHQATGERRYLDGALGGARYLQSIARTEGNVCLIPHNQPDGLELFYLGWCHGPVGTARLWHVLRDITGEPRWQEWIDRSAQTLIRSGLPEARTDGYWNNVSQCCGSAGVAQFFLDLYLMSNDRRYLEFAKRMTTDLLDRATRDERGLRWIQAEHRVRPEQLAAQTGYMQGAAGIGMWLLRLDAAERGERSGIRFPDDPWR